MSKRSMNSRRRALETGWADGLTRANRAQGGEIRAAYGRWNAKDGAEIEGLKARLEVIGTTYEEAKEEIKKLAEYNSTLAEEAQEHSVELKRLLVEARLAAKEAAEALARSNGDTAEVQRLSQELKVANANIQKLRKQAQKAASDAWDVLRRYRKRAVEETGGPGGGASGGASGAGAQPKRRRLPKGEVRKDYGARVGEEDAEVNFDDLTFKGLILQQPLPERSLVSGILMPTFRPDGSQNERENDIPPTLIPGQRKNAKPVWVGRYNNVDYWTVDSYDDRVFYYNYDVENRVEEWRSLDSNKPWRAGIRAMNDRLELRYDPLDPEMDGWREVLSKFSISSRYGAPRRKPRRRPRNADVGADYPSISSRYHPRKPAPRPRRPRRPRIVDVGADYSMHSLDLNA